MTWRDELVDWLRRAVCLVIRHRLQGGPDTYYCTLCSYWFTLDVE